MSHLGSTEYDIIVMDADQTGYIPIPPTAVFETVKSSRSVLKLGDKLYFSYGEDFRIVLVAWPGY